MFDMWKRVVVTVVAFVICKQTIAKKAVVKTGTMKSGWYHAAYSTNSVPGSMWSDPKRENQDFSSVCGGGTDFWLTTPHLPLKDVFAEVIYVEIDADLTNDCDPKPCDNYYFEVYVNQSENKLNVMSNNNFFTKNFRFVYNITNKTTPGAPNRRENQTFTFLKRGTKGVTFAIRSQGACGALYRIKMYYYYCEEKFISSIRFAKTVTPERGIKKLVIAQCSENSSPLSEGLLQGYCSSDGRWMISNNAKCFCNEGFAPNETRGCSPCVASYFKASSSNEDCQACPKNNVATEDRTGCKCREGYYSFSKLNIKPTVCHPLPRYALKLNIEFINLHTVNLTWPAPNSSMLKYEVVCHQCLQAPSCNASCDNVEYTPRREYLTQTFVKISKLKPDASYVFRVYPINNVNNLADRGKWNYTEIRYFSSRPVAKKPYKDEKFGPYIYVVAAACVVLFLTVIILVSVIVRRRVNFKRGLLLMNVNQMELPSAGHRMYIDPTIYDSPEDALNEFACELDRSTVVLEMLIGGGEFGDVYKGQMSCNDKNVIPVAIKTLKHDANAKSVKDFLLEASVMAQFHDPNVIKLQGVLTKSTPRMIVIEFMANGSLDHFLQNNDNKLSRLQLISMTRGVASGMKYLSGINFVHRDLAARNILVNEKLLCKISDFGLSRALETEGDCRGEYSTSGGKIPIRWTAPEAIGYRKFSSASDVWSFGILLWEIMSFADRPYGQWDNYTVMKQVDEGFRLPAPQGCPNTVHDLMARCWKASREERPTFADILDTVDNWIKSPDIVRSHVDPSNNLSQWLKSIKMGTYTWHLVSAGYHTPAQLIGLQDRDLIDMGIKLIGHRNKILKSIKALEHHMNSERERTSSVAV